MNLLKKLSYQDLLKANKIYIGLFKKYPTNDNISMLLNIKNELKNRQSFCYRNRIKNN